MLKLIGQDIPFLTAPQKSIIHVIQAKYWVFFKPATERLSNDGIRFEVSSNLDSKYNRSSYFKLS